MHLYSNLLCKLYFNTVKWDSKYKFIHIINRNNWNKYVSRTKFIKNTFLFLCFRNIYNFWAERSPFWSISSSELTVANVFLLLNYLPCFYLKTNKQTKNLCLLLFMTFIIHLAMSQIKFLPNHFVLILPWLSFNALSPISVTSSNSFKPLFISPLCRVWSTSVTLPLTLFPYKDDRPSLFKAFIRSFSLFIFCWALLHLFCYEVEIIKTRLCCSPLCSMCISPGAITLRSTKVAYGVRYYSIQDSQSALEWLGLYTIFQVQRGNFLCFQVHLYLRGL